MKKILSIFVIFLAFFVAFDNAVFAKNQIKFIYVHGTNDNNKEKEEEFINYVHRLHKQLVIAFGNSEIAQRNLLENGKYTIAEEPVAFYWGMESKKNLNLLADWLDITKFFSPKLAQTVRTMIAHTFHDAIWIQKYNNMKPIVDKLQKLALQAEADGDKYILLGHSAGSFITSEYFVYKMPFVNMEEFLKIKNIPQDKLAQIKKIGYRNTCIDAMIDSGFAVFKRDYRFYIPNENMVANYKKIATVEKTSCLPKIAAAGMINFGSPLSLFYSGFADTTEIPANSMYKAILRDNIFYLTLNFAEDPLGFPTSGENDYKMLMELVAAENIKSPHGFVYDKSNIRSNRALFNSHSAYWIKDKFFAKEVVKAYEEGFNKFNPQ